MIRPMLLYNSQVSGNCYKVRLLFAHLGQAYERQEVDVIDRSDRPELLGHLNPVLRVPTLVLDDGRVMAESNAITYYFADGTDYLPDDPWERAQVLRWMFFEQNNHEPNIAVPRFWRIASIDPSPEELKARRSGGEAALRAMEAHLTDHEFFAGDRYTIADIALYGYTHVAPEGGFELDAYPAINTWLTRVRSQPGHVPITA